MHGIAFKGGAGVAVDASRESLGIGFGAFEGVVASAQQQRDQHQAQPGLRCMCGYRIKSCGQCSRVCMSCLPTQAQAPMIQPILRCDALCVYVCSLSHNVFHS